MKKAIAALLLAGAAATCYALLFGGEGYGKMRQLQKEISEQKNKNNEVRDDNDNIAKEIRAAKDNPESNAKHLREHNFVKEDEIFVNTPPDEE